MGRELKRKQSKKEGKNVKETLIKEKEIKENNEIYSFLKISIILIIVLVIVYLLAGIFITKEFDLFNNNDTEETDNTVANKIIASSIFNQKEEEYYVYFYDFDEEASSTLTTINSKLSSKKVYKVDTGDSLNQNYITEEDSNTSATSLEDLKVKTNTLIKIVNDEIVSYYEEDEITDNLK